MKCHEEVPDSEGIAGPCDRPAVGWRIDPEANQPYPVCVTHHRWPYADEWVADRAKVERVEALADTFETAGRTRRHGQASLNFAGMIHRALDPDAAGGER